MSQVTNLDITRKEGVHYMLESEIFNTKESALVIEQVEMAIFTGIFITRDDGEYDFFAVPGVENIDRILGLYQRSLPPEKASGPRPQILGLVAINVDVKNKRVFIRIPTHGNIYTLTALMGKRRLQDVVQRQLPEEWQVVLYI